MKILFVSQYFYPESFRGNDIAFDWVKRGVDVTVIAAIPNYPTGKFFKGYGIFKKRKEIINGLQVIHIPVVARGKGGAIRLMLNYLSFAIFGSIYCFYISFKQKFDFIFVHQPSPITMALPAIVVKKMQKIPLYLWVLDLWPESLTSAGNINNKYVLLIFKLLVKYIYKNVTKLLISSRGFINSITEKGNYSDKIIYLPSWAEDVFNQKLNKFAELPTFPEGFVVMFAGNIGEAQDFNNIMNCALLLKNQLQIKFAIVGDGRKKDWVQSFVKENQLHETVYLMGRYPLESMPSFFQKASAMLITLKDEEIFNLTVPSKLQPYMSSGKPIIAMLNGEGSHIIEEANCGMCVKAGNFKELAEKIELMSQMPKTELIKLGSNGKSYCNEFFDKSKSLNFLFNLVSNNPQGD